MADAKWKIPNIQSCVIHQKFQISICDHIKCCSTACRIQEDSQETAKNSKNPRRQCNVGCMSEKERGLPHCGASQQLTHLLNKRLGSAIHSIQSIHIDTQTLQFLKNLNCKNSKFRIEIRHEAVAKTFENDIHYNQVL